MDLAEEGAQGLVVGLGGVGDAIAQEDAEEFAEALAGIAELNRAGILRLPGAGAPAAAGPRDLLTEGRVRVSRDLHAALLAIGAAEGQIAPQEGAVAHVAGCVTGLDEGRVEGVGLFAGIGRFGEARLEQAVMKQTPVLIRFAAVAGPALPAEGLAFADHPALDGAAGQAAAHDEAGGADLDRIEGRQAEGVAAHFAARDVEGPVHGQAQQGRVLVTPDPVGLVPALTAGGRETAGLGVLQEARYELVVQVAVQAHALVRAPCEPGRQQARRVMDGRRPGRHGDVHHMFPAPGV